MNILKLKDVPVGEKKNHVQNHDFLEKRTKI